MKPLYDLTGQKFGRWEVLAYSERKANGKHYWKCRCECGTERDVYGSELRTGKSTSCGCYRRERTSQARKKNLIGKVFDRLTVVKEAGQTPDKEYLWECCCVCGNIITVRGNSLTSGNTKSCGCLQKERTSNANRVDISGQRFGKLIALHPTEKRTIQHGVIWKCKCDCGSEIEYALNTLKEGKAFSCGCIKSKGDERIGQLLTQNKISFSKEHTFLDCLNLEGNKLRFDFLINNAYLIEYDGEQHFKTQNHGWNTEEYLNKIQIHDKIKNQYCFEHNIPLIRIPYTHLSKLCLEDLLLETSQFIVVKKQED